MPRSLASSRLPGSGNAALASGALIQAAIGLEFVLAGLNKIINPNYVEQFRGFIGGSPGALAGPLAPLIQALVIPNIDAVAELSRWTEFGAGAVLLVTALEVLRRRLAIPLGAPHPYEPAAALLSAIAAFVLGGMSLSIYVLQGGRLPSLNPGYSFSSPIAIELLLVPLAFGIAWLELGRFRALRAAS
jgi:hypothetical protein